MDYATAKTEKAALEIKYRAACKQLASLPGVGSSKMGLTPDEVRQTPEYRAAQDQYRAAFRRLQEYNRWFCKLFKNEIRTERRG
jgi:hypothetical protein